MYDRASGCTLQNRKHEQNTRVVITILTVNADSTTMQHGDPCYGGFMRHFCIHYTYSQFEYDITTPWLCRIRTDYKPHALFEVPIAGD